MDVDAALAALPEFRALAESRMLSTVTVRRVNPDDPTAIMDGFEIPNWLAAHTGIPFRLGGSQQGGSGSRTVRVGDTEVEVATRTGHFPASTGDLLDNDLIEVTAGENVGAVLRIVEATWQDQATARRVPVVEVQRPAEWV